MDSIIIKKYHNLIKWTLGVLKEEQEKEDRKNFERLDDDGDIECTTVRI